MWSFGGCSKLGLQARVTKISKLDIQLLEMFPVIIAVWELEKSNMQVPMDHQFKYHFQQLTQKTQRFVAVLLQLLF